MYSTLAAAILALHLLFILRVMFGVVVTRRRPVHLARRIPIKEAIPLIRARKTGFCFSYNSSRAYPVRSRVGSRM